MSRLLFPLAALLAFATFANAQQTDPLPPNPAHRWLSDSALAPVPTDGFLFVSVKASKLWDNPAAKPFRDWIATQKEDPFAAMIGVTAAEVDRVTLFLATWDGDAGGAPVVLVTTRQQYNEAKVLKALGVGQKNDARVRAAGRTARLEGGEFRWVVFVDERTLLFLSKDIADKSHGGELVARLIARKTDGPLAGALSEAVNHDLTLGVDVRPISRLLHDERDDVPRDLVPFLTLLKAKTATFTADFDKSAKGKLVMSFPDAATAKRAGPVLEEGMKLIAGLLANEPVRQPNGINKHILGWISGAIKSAKVTAEGENVIAAGDVGYTEELTKLVAALPKSWSITRANLEAMNNLKQLALAMHNHESAYAFFPSDISHDGDKAAAMSWRVQILPFVEQAQLYQLLDMTKPWDDPANLKKLEAMAMPKVFEHPGRPAPKGHTYFRIFSYPKNAKGNDRPFLDEGRRGPKVVDFTDGLSNTFMIVEAGEAVPWYKPDVLAYDGKLPLPQLGDKEADIFLAAFADGSVRSFKPSKLGEKTLRAMITRAGGEVFTFPER